MKNPNYINITCKSAINKVRGVFPFTHDLNIYRGCAHACRYCFALYSHRYMGVNPSDFFNDIYVKTNIVEALERQLSSKSWKRELLNLGGVTDSYQPVEASRKLMPEIWKLLIRYRTPAIISTKSSLILRDYELIDELSRKAFVNVACTITAADERVCAAIEPGASPVRERFEVLRVFGGTKASTGMHVMPVIPRLTDGRENIRALFAGARESGVDYVICDSLGLRGQTRGVFFNFLALQYPHLREPFAALYRTGRLDREYKKKLFEMIGELLREYGLSCDYRNSIREEFLSAHATYRQRTLF